MSRVVLAFLLFLAVPLHAQSLSFVEDFSTRAFEEVTSFSADWDTVAAQLRPLEFTPTNVGVLAITGTPTSLFARDGYAFVGTASAGIQVVDVSAPTAPALVSTIGVAAPVESIRWNGDLGLFGTGTSDFYAVLLGDPTVSASASPSAVGGQTHDVDFQGNAAYVAAGTAGLQVFDATLGPIGGLTTTSPVRAVECAGAHVWLGRDDGVQLVDVTDRTAPVSIAVFGFGASVVDVVARGDRVFALSSAGDLIVIEDAYGAGSLSSTSTAAAGVDLEVFGDRAFVAAGNGGVVVLDVGDPFAPTLLRTLPAGDARAVAVDRGVLHVADATGSLRSIEWASRGRVTAKGFAFQIASYSDGDREGDVLWAAGESSGVVAFDIGDPSAPSVLSVTSVASFARGIAVDGKYAYVAELNTGLLVLDVSDPTAPVAVTTLGGIFSATAVDVDGEYAYVTGGLGVGSPTLYVVDVSDPSAPTLISSWSATNFFVDFVDVVASYGRVYLAAENGGVVVADVGGGAVVGTPTTLPSQGGSIDHIALEGNSLYGAESSTGLRIWDTNTLAPTATVFYGTQFGALAVDERTVYASTGSVVSVFDVSDPANPSIAGGSVLGSGTSDVLVLDGRKVAVAQGLGASVALDLSDRFDAVRVLGVSSPVDGADERIVSVRGGVVGQGVTALIAQGSGGNAFLSAGADYTFLGAGSEDLSFTVELDPYASGTPFVDEVSLEWRIDRPVVAAIDDVPNDQGGWVRLQIEASGYDVATSPIAIVGYNVLRRIDDPASMLARAEAVDEDDLRFADGRRIVPGLEGVVAVDDRYFVTESAASPPGTWEIVGSFFASRRTDYTFLAPTTGGSSTFHVVALGSDGETFASDGFLGVSTDDIAPGVPTGFGVAYGASDATLSWDPAPEADFQYHRVYRSTDPDFVPSAATLVHETAATSWVDPDDTAAWTWKLTTLDAAGNESDPARVDTATATPPALRVALEPPHPNPFNPRTTVAFTVPGADDTVQLTVHDASGRRVRTLVNGAPGIGRHAVVWEGADDRGRRVASGVYHVRLRVGSAHRHAKLVLVE